MLKFFPSFYNVDKNALILKIVCFFWLLAKLASRRIWTTDRLLPSVPVFAFLDQIPALVQMLLFIASIILLASLVFVRNKLLLIVLLCVETLACMFDQNRLLPWEYFYMFIILVFMFNFNKPALIPVCIALILASTYFYSGLSKLNDGFLQIVWTNMIMRRSLKIPMNVASQSWLHYSGYLPGVIEAIAGVGLLFKRTKFASAIVLVLMHIFILLLFGPWGIRGYRVLWPWNISMVLFLSIVFVNKNGLTEGFQPLTQGWNKLVVLCWVVLPAFSFIGYWDKNLSSNLFSANLPRMVICIADTTKCSQLKRFFSKKDVDNTCHGQAKIDIQTWAIAETGASAYPEMRTFSVMQKKLEKQYTGAGFTFVYLNR